MRIMGIDPGTVITGIGIIEIRNDRISAIDIDCINLNKKLPIPERLKIIYEVCSEKMLKHKPDEFAIETAFYHKNIQSTLKLGQARGVALIAAVNSKLNISEYSPREIKKSVTGSGASSKEQVQFMIKSILSLKENPKFIDSSDALAVALCHYFSGGAGIQNGFKKAPKSKNSWGKFVEQNPDKVLARK
ncbi:MAG: crossover junction endodeoxyribonuclease RuvC [Ignavibacteria bacterium]|nr:crossover junction endodeoxyribonuclease RuvC [Ignavibacteria bacterium]